jgi:hypothetical protein
MAVDRRARERCSHDPVRSLHASRRAGKRRQCRKQDQDQPRAGSFRHLSPRRVMLTIHSIRATPVIVPLERPIGTATCDWIDFSTWPARDSRRLPMP